MERLTERDANCADPKEIYGVRVKNHDYISAANRLADYEDTGLTPQEVISIHGEWRAMMSVLNSIGGGYTRLRELAEADKDGRLVVLGHPRRRVMWGDVEPDRLLCPECGNDLAGGFPEQASANLEMVNCPYCGEYLNLGRKTEAEKALEAMKVG